MHLDFRICIFPSRHGRFYKKAFLTSQTDNRMGRWCSLFLFFSSSFHWFDCPIAILPPPPRPPPKKRDTSWLGLQQTWLSQIIATSHDLTPNGGLVREIPYFREIWVGEILFHLTSSFDQPTWPPQLDRNSEVFEDPEPWAAKILFRQTSWAEYTEFEIRQKIKTVKWSKIAKP